ncbi:aarF domain-containing protein kinase 1-like isoform X2 [Homarus americanus]|uniref:aarF domain-containing protein kinase 1-like isoform X2 n=1 Tax=Homarus americanus TaxID=6706 RepID=UPI001C478D3D|nr:aarF domain-containing protein kinase 1-like isoform X2 [Homarus americanus]
MAHRMLLRLGLLGVGGASITYNIDELETAAIGALRFGRAAVAVTKIITEYRSALYSGSITPESDNYKEMKSQTHLHSARELLDLCCTNGGAFVKVGQHLGSLEYLLPVEYVNTMKVLHSNAPRSSLEDVYQVIEEELKCKPKELFLEFEPEPLGAASLAQVHRAKLHDGREVAVKVQHRSVKAHSKVDMKGMELLVKMVSHIFPDFRFEWLVEEMKKNLPKELDFMHEARNAEKVAAQFAHFSWLKIPFIDWSHTTDRVLVMEFCEGGQVNDRNYMVAKGINTSEVSERIGRLYSEMIFVNGYVHCDPHPGNVLVKKVNNEAQIILLDHGLYTQDAIKADAAKYLPEISAVLNRVPRQMLLILKTNDLLRGIEFSLNTQESMKSFITMSRCCIRSLFAHQRILCNSTLCSVRVSVAETWAQFKISLYTLYLLYLRSKLGKYIHKTWMTNNGAVTASCL